MNHIDLFSGIGGFAYAARMVWGEEYHNVLFCDNNKFCQQVIRKQFGKDSVIYGDIRDVTNPNRHGLQEQGQKQQASGDRQFSEITPNTRSEESRGLSGGIGQEISETWRCDLLTGGFPCQPFSAAGKRRGTQDNRYLWPEMLRVIREFQPTWVIAENVRGLLTINEGLVFEQVCADLEREGYEVQPLIIPAVAVNAPHRRDRVWFVANRKNINGERRDRKRIGAGRSKVPHRNENWNQDWLEVATELCGMDDGLPAELDGFKLSKAQHRVERLKALGNAIVSQVAIEIMQAIKDLEVFND